jgi:hypothetical protein
MTCCIALAVAQLPGPMSVLPVHVERETNCQSLTFASHRPCAAVRAHVYGAEETVHGSSVDGVCVPCINYRRYTSKQVQACSLHLPQRPWVACLEKYTADELFCMERTRRASHATPNALVYTALACCTSSIGANVPIQSRCGASPETPGAKSQNGQIAGCGAQLRCTGPLPCQFRQSLPAAWVVTHKTKCACFAAVGWDGASWAQLSHHSTLAHARAPPSSKRSNDSFPGLNGCPCDEGASPHLRRSLQ